MPYRQGAMARAGDYYNARPRGDIFGFLGTVVKGVAKVGSFIPGPIGVISGAMGGLSGAAKQNTIGATLPPPLVIPSRQAPTITRTSGFQAGPVLIGSQTTSTFGGVSGGSSSTAPSACGKKHRRMNVSNVKALRRAGRRVKGFEKLARRFIGFASPHRPKGRTYFKSRKRSR